MGDDLTYLKLLLRMFNLFGLSTISAIRKRVISRPSFESSRLALIYNASLILLVAAMNYSQARALYVTKLRTLFNIVDLFEITFGTLVSLLILSYYALRQSASISFVSKIYATKRKIDRLKAGCRTTGKSAFLRALAFLAFHLVTTVGILVSGIVYHDDPLDFFSGASRNLVVTWLLVQYATVVRVLVSMFESVNGALEVLVPRIEDKILEGSGKPGTLTTIRKLHAALLEACEEVTGFYEITILGGVAYVFVCLIVFTYFLVDPVIERKINFSKIEYVHFFLWLVCFTSAFVALARYVTKITNELDRTGTIVHRLIERTSNAYFLKELQDFSSALLHEEINFTAWGFFSLDGTLVQSTFSSITTYLVILIQFQLGSK